MKTGTLSSILQDIPQSPSYTPSSFIKGFIPEIVLESACQSPLPLKKARKRTALSSETESALKKSLAYISLYRNPIPPNLISISNKTSVRPKTLKIVKTTFDDKKEVEIINPSGLDGKKVLTNDQINRNDSLKTVKCFLDRSMKGYDQKKRKEKTKGSMYINDLWSEGYQKSILEAAHLDVELKKENLHYRRPLAEKFEDLSNLYEKRLYDPQVRGIMEDFQSHRPLTVQSLFGKIPPIRDLGDSEGLQGSKSQRTPNSGSPIRNNKVTDVDSVKTPQANRSNINLFNRKTAALEREKNSRRKVYTEESSSKKNEMAGTKTKSQMQLNNLLSVRPCTNQESKKQILKDRYSPLIKRAYSPVSTAATNKPRFGHSQYEILTEMYPETPFKVMKSNSPSSSIIHNNYFGKEYLLSFNRKITDFSREGKGIMSETHEAMVDLLHKCDAELEEREEYLNTMKNMQLAKNKKFDWEKDRTKQQKEKLLNTFKSMLKNKGRTLKEP